MGLSWLPNGHALTVLDTAGNLAFCNADGHFLAVTSAGQRTKVGTFPGLCLSEVCLPCRQYSMLHSCERAWPLAAQI